MGIFKEEELIISKLRELEPIKNDIAHSRDLTRQQFERLKLNSEDIMRSVGAF